MPDLTIKPVAAAGNKLILQDQAGGAVLTTADSGATLANGLAIGTPASGTLTNCTFPAGHVLQSVFNTEDTQASVTGNSLVTAIAGAITLSNASNKILALWSIPFVIYSYGGSSNTTGTVYGGFQVVSSGTGVSAETKKWGSYTNAQGLYGFAVGGDVEERNHKSVFTGCWVFTPGTTNATTITVQGGGYNDDTMAVNNAGGDTPYHGHSQIVLQEIQV